jgi:uncharacterized protein with HEPN domain
VPAICVVADCNYTTEMDALVAIGEACRQLAGGGEDAGGPPPAAIVMAHPEIDWRGGIGLRNVLTHGYHRRDPPVIWRATGELAAPVRACEPGIGDA